MPLSRTIDVDVVPPPGGVVVYSVLLSVEATDEHELELLSSLLTPEERVRADRYRQPADRRRFVLMRGTLRLLLGRCTGLRPEAIVLAYGSRGKPSLDGSRLQFNVSHSGDLGLVALAIDIQVGVDVEVVDTTISLEGMPQLVMSPREQRVFETLPRNRRHRSFFDHWVCKEAVLKAGGRGLAIPPTLVEVQPFPATAPAMRIAHDSERCWWFQHFNATLTHTAAVAAAAPPASVSHRRLERSSWLVSLPERSRRASISNKSGPRSKQPGQVEELGPARPKQAQD